MKVEHQIVHEDIDQKKDMVASLNKITFRHPGEIIFGVGSFDQFVADFATLGHTRLFVLAIPVLKEIIEDKFTLFSENGISVEINYEIEQEPSFEDFQSILHQAQVFNADSVVGIGGGSVMDAAKLLAAMIGNKQNLNEVVSSGVLAKRNTYLACLPTTSGTGSEVSPNAIFFNNTDKGKTGIISPSLVPDSAYIDPNLTIGLPPAITASTSLDALTHCIEAYVNRFAHPMCDVLALEGIRLIGENLITAFQDGLDLNARSNLALGSVYGGMCLGPVNTGAVHALAYPLGSMFKIPHGLANAILLPHVMEYNISAEPAKYAKVALALGAPNLGNDTLTAKEGVWIIRELISDCSIPSKLSELGIEKTAIEDMAHSAMKIQRLLKNNVREVSVLNAVDIYMNAF